MWFSVVTACLSVLFKQNRQFYFLLIFFFLLFAHWITQVIFFLNQILDVKFD